MDNRYAQLVERITYAIATDDDDQSERLADVYLEADEGGKEGQETQSHGRVVVLYAAGSAAALDPAFVKPAQHIGGTGQPMAIEKCFQGLRVVTHDVGWIGSARQVRRHLIKPKWSSMLPRDNGQRALHPQRPRQTGAADARLFVQLELESLRGQRHRS